MDGTMIKEQGAKIERATHALIWLNDCGRQAALATAPGSALSFDIETRLGASAVGYAEANSYLRRACQEMASAIEARAEELAQCHLSEAREAVLSALGSA